MTVMRSLSLVTLTIVGLCTVSASRLDAQEKVEVEGIRNFSRVSTTIACGGATSPDAMAAIKDMGYVSVINLRLPDENGATNDAGRAAAEAVGMKYIHLPFTPTAPDREATVERFIEEVGKDENLPAYVHCGSANRVGGLWMIKRVLVDGWDQPAALTEAEAIGLSSQPVRDFVTEYLATHQR
jgi:uncharacterized protein (TIGR01244 family)